MDEELMQAESPKRAAISPVTVVLAILLVAALAVIAVLLLPRLEHDDADTPHEDPAPVEKLTDSIDIPGYGGLNLKAGQAQQTLALSNPPENFCWFRTTLALEDGTVLWTSELFGPGESSEPIVLGQPLERGTYANAVLLYECFADAQGTQALNGASMNLELHVS